MSYGFQARFRVDKIVFIEDLGARRKRLKEKTNETKVMFRVVGLFVAERLHGENRKCFRVYTITGQPATVCRETKTEPGLRQLRESVVARA